MTYDPRPTERERELTYQVEKDSFVLLEECKKAAEAMRAKIEGQEELIHELEVSIRDANNFILSKCL